MKFKAAIFDLDGTLADTIPLTIYSIKETIKRFTGKDLSDEEVLNEFGPVDLEIVKKFVPEDKREEAVECYINLFSDKFNEFIKPIDGVKELLKALKLKGMKLGLFTGRGITVAEIIIEKLGLKEYLDVILAGEHTKKPKPDPEGIILALDTLGVNCSESIYTGDFDADIMASRAAGTFSVLALWSSTKSEKLIDLKPDKYFYSPLEFKEWIENI
jgi:pyrophosphatase PpaX